MWGLLLVSVLSSSCEKDKGTLAKRAIVGTWKIDRIVQADTVLRNAGEITYTSNQSDVVPVYSLNNELYEAKSTINGQVTDFSYELSEGSTDLILNHYDDAGRPSGVFIEMFTKDILIYSLGSNYKLYLSK